jgi:hypothetical protein
MAGPALTMTSVSAKSYPLRTSQWFSNSRPRKEVITLATKDQYEAALKQAETNPSNMNKEQERLVARLQSEVGARGNRARNAYK